jgi:hypothetical protein
LTATKILKIADLGLIVEWKLLLVVLFEGTQIFYNKKRGGSKWQISQQETPFSMICLISDAISTACSAGS